MNKARREIVRDFIAEFPESGPFDIGVSLFQPLPPMLTFRLLLGLEDEQLNNARFWIDEITFGSHDHDVSESNVALMKWLQELIASRKSEVNRRSDMVDGLVHGTVEGGRSLTDEELIGSVLILLLGGFLTTTEATSTFLVRIAEDVELQDRLRENPTLLPAAIEEHLRLMPPVPMLARKCTAHVDLAGTQLEPGTRVAWLTAAANRDPGEFDRPNEFDLERPRNRHLTFGGGVHRCIGSNFARMTIRITFEELLSNFDKIRIAEGDSVDWVYRAPSFWYVAQRIPVTVTKAKT